MDKVQRRLAGILAADVVGYSAMVGTDEPATLARVRTLRTDLIEPVAATHGGRLFKTTGDGFLVAFASAVQALRCAIAIQERLRSEPDGLRLRIGVHQGEVVAEGDDLLGDGVIIAARLEPLAEPGGICISARVREDAAGKMALEVDDLGTPELKNIAAKIQVFRVRLGAAERPGPAAARQAVDRGAAVPEHERRSRAGVFRRRHGRGHHHRAVAHPLAVRHRAQFELHLQGPRGRCAAGRPRTRRALRAGRQRAQGRRTACASLASWSMRRPARMSGPTGSTARWRTCSICRIRSRQAWSRQSSQTFSKPRSSVRSGSRRRTCKPMTAYCGQCHCFADAVVRTSSRWRPCYEERSRSIPAMHSHWSIWHSVNSTWSRRAGQTTHPAR